MPVFPFYPNYYNNYYPHYHNNYYNNRNLQNCNTIINNENQEKKEEKIEEEKNGQEKVKKQNKEMPETRNYNSNTKETNNQKRTSKYNSFANINISALLESDLNTPIVEILGIKLYLDDLIIIGLLFFLYKEDVQDEILFGILLLLLLS